jgi:hypothetical protein
MGMKTKEEHAEGRISPQYPAETTQEQAGPVIPIETLQKEGRDPTKLSPPSPEAPQTPPAPEGGQKIG